MCMKMEEPGTDAVKRQRIDSYGASVRLPNPPTPIQHQHHNPHQHHPHQQHPEGPLPVHEYSSPPNHRQAPPYSHPTVSPSPYATIHHGPPPPYPPPPPHPHPSITPHEQHPSSHDHRNGPFGAPIQERPPPADTNPLHGVGNPSVTHSPENRQAPTLRPLETSFAEVQPYPQHSSHGTPPNYPSQGPPPHHQSQQPPPPPNGHSYHSQGLPIQPHYEQGPPPPQSAPPYADMHGPPYSAGPYGPPGSVPWRGPYPQQPQNQGIPKKGSRATQACETCRQRKAKCDEGKPTCGYCKETRVHCVYKEMQPAKADRAQKEIMDSLKETNSNYENLRGYFTRLDQKVDNVQSVLGTLNKIASFIDGLKQPNGLAAIKAELPHLATDPSFEVQLGEQMYAQSPGQTECGDIAPVVKIEDTSIVNHTHIAGHTVMAHRLLQWRSIKELLGNKAPEDDYTMLYEERKGILRVFGKGQGLDTYDGAISGSPSSPASSTSDEVRTHSPRYPASQDYYWGDRVLGLPNIVDGKFFGDQKTHLGGLTATGGLLLDKNTMSELMESYLSNIHILHPFLDRTRLRRMVEKVWRDYNPTEAASNKSPFIPNTPYPLGGNSKRKWSVGGGSPEEANGYPPVNGLHPNTAPHLPCRISTVIVLLVMALGKICQYTDPLPGFAPATSVNTENANRFQQAISPITTASSPLTPSDLRGITGGKRGSISTAIHHKAMRKDDRNLDVIPGFAYFAEASTMLGSLQGNDLAYAQAYLLAAIYTAQLTCVVESWTWINNACRVCSFLVRDTRFSKVKDKKRVDLTRFVYLACLQLESDILAELNLQPSGLQQLDPEGSIGVPSGVVEEIGEIESAPSQPDDILLYYNYQLSLRKCMNDWQRHLYPASRDDSDQQIVTNLRGNYSLSDREYCESTLSALREMMQKHPELSWTDDEPPATYINAARLRGKYYGAKYFIHRPFLRYALHTFTQANLNPRIMAMYYDYIQNPANYRLEAKPEADEDNLDWWTFQFLMSCHMCVVAAQKSTIAFDGVLKTKRLMVTNLFGTAHAQFGNMLVLSAVHTSKLLSFLIDETEFKRLLDRTIDFLRSLAPISSTLKKDCELLSIIRERINSGFKSSSDYINPSASFGSFMGS